MSAKSATAGKSDAPAFQEIGREQKRRFILDAAAAIFGAKGFHAATVKDIAEQAGIAHGTFYLYFKDKKDVYLALADRFQAQVMDAILPGGATPVLAQEADLPGLMRKRLASLARLFESRKGIARIFVYRAPGTDPEFEEHRRRFVRQLTDAIAAVLAAGAERGVFRRHEPRVAAMCLVGSIDMVIESWLQKAGERAGPSLVQMMAEAARVFEPALLTAKARRRAAERTASASRGKR